MNRPNLSPTITKDSGRTRHSIHNKSQLPNDIDPESSQKDLLSLNILTDKKKKEGIYCV